MMIIDSEDNKIYKKCRKLATKKYREKYGQYLIEGEKVVCEAFQSGEDIDKLIVREGSDRSVIGAETKTIYMSARLFDEMSDTKTSQGIAAIINKKHITKESFSREINRDPGNVVVLDRLQDPGNIGTIIRTADAAGYKGVIAVKGTGDIFSPKVVRAASGSLFRIPVIFTESEEQTIKLLKDNNKRVISTSLEADKAYWETDLTENVALVIGNEGNGISGVFIRSATETIKIPMHGTIDSLNAAVAAGILMYQSVRK